MGSYVSPEQSVEKRNARMDAAGGHFQEAQMLAQSGGLLLCRFTSVHYQLSPRDRSWVLNIYPSNRRLYHDKSRPGPFLRVRANWTLLDVVTAALEESTER